MTDPVKAQRTRQEKAPLYEAVVNYVRKHKVSFHTPGHKHGSAIPAAFRRFVGETVFDMDLTLLAEVDSLHEPQTVIRAAQILAAEAYGSDQSYFLVNGSTAGNQAMILSTCQPGDLVLVPRNAHQSVLAGVLLAGCEPIFMRPEINKELGLYTNVTVGTVEAALKRWPQVKAVLVTSPTYHGIAADVARIAELVHERNLPLLVDEAHGPHLKFHDELPLSAIESGADMCVQSTHKILAGMTQSSLLHVRGDRIDTGRLRKVLKLLTTTSPSYILMSSIDMARRQMALDGRRLLGRALKLARKAREEINKIEGLQCFGRECIGQAGIYDLDETKLTIACAGIGATGYEVAKELNKKYGIQVEYADLFSVFLIVSFGNTDNEIRRLILGLRATAQKMRGKRKKRAKPVRWELPGFSARPAVNPRYAFFAPKEVVSLEKAVGRVSAETISPYPPGIPLVVPGERLDKEAVRAIRALQAAGCRIQGPEDASLDTLKVVKTRGRGSAIVKEKGALHAEET
jgi:arginine/lysine/ornithine decarboxylase